MSATTPYPGKLIVVEGADGAGKTELCVALAAALRAHTGIFEVTELREPGGTQLSEHLRTILKGQLLPGALTSARAEALLFASARAQLTEEVLRPALERGVWCILDRWLHSSLIYQGLARGLPVDEVKQLSIFATANLRADRVLALQVSAETARARQRDRDGGDGDRIEESVNAETIRNGYADLKTLDGHAVVEVSAEGTREEMLSLCWQAISDLLP